MSGPVPRESAGRCALQAQLRGDPMLGTAPPAARLLLVEQPGPWGPRGLRDSRADPLVSTRIDELAVGAGMRVQAVREPGRHADTDAGHRIAIVDTRRRVASWWRVDTLPELVEQLVAATEPPPDAVDDAGPAYLVCTHGRHDACCALRGRPLATALAAVRPGRVWETTHLGGDRFAANLLVAPTGELYGRVLPFAATDLVGHVERGEVVPGIMRGRLGLAPVAQAALVHAHAQLGLVLRDDLRVEAVERIDDELSRVVLRTPTGRVAVDVATPWSDPHRLTCRGASDARARAYRGLAIRPLD